MTQLPVCNTKDAEFTLDKISALADMTQMCASTLREALNNLEYVYSEDNDLREVAMAQAGVLMAAQAAEAFMTRYLRPEMKSELAD